MTKRKQKLRTLDQVVADHVVLALEVCNGSVSEAARELGAHRRTVQRMMRRYRIKVKRARAR